MRPLDFALLAIFSMTVWQSRVFAQTPPASSGSNHPAAVSLIDAAIKALSRPEGVQAKFRLTLLSRSQPAVITGESITAEKQRARVELNYKQAERTAQLKLLCDGTTFYRIESMLESKAYTSYSLKDLQEALAKLATNETERVAKEDVEKEQQGMHGFEGIAAMVKDLKSRMVFGEPKPATIEWEGKPQHPAKVIEGQWASEVLDLIAPLKKGTDTNQQDQRYLWNEGLYFFGVPRQARLYFDATTQQLLRVELLGITEKKAPDKPLPIKVLSFVDVLSITPLTTLDPKLFMPTEAEKQYRRVDVDLLGEVKNRHQQTLNILKMQQQMQK